MRSFLILFIGVLTFFYSNGLVEVELSEEIHKWNQNASKNYFSDFLDAYEFLVKYEPDRDKDLPKGFREANIALSLAARYTHTWSRNVDFGMFKNYVLPYASVSEPREMWRIMFFEKFSSIVKQASSTGEAAMLLNKNIWKIWGIVFKPNQTPLIMSPSQVIKNKCASCTGLSIFLVNACRSVGIPARLTGIPVWNTQTGGNHDWVEVYHNGSWHFMGAAEPAEHLDNAWFYPYPTNTSIPGSHLHAIYATSWKSDEQTTIFPMEWDKGTYVKAYDVTKSYLKN